MVLEATSTFLACGVSNIPFLFLGISIGYKIRRLTTWRRLLDKVRSQLSKWKEKFLSLGGRVTLLNYLLSSILI